jgi:hypothetical protein
MTEEKVKFQMRISPETDRKIKAAMPLSNCRSQNEFVENALCFYSDYLVTQDSFSVLPPLLVKSFRATVQDSENRVCRLLFKQAVEMDMMMNVLAAGMEISQSELEQLRIRCVQEVKKTSGAVSFKDAVTYQNDAE